MEIGSFKIERYSDRYLPQVLEVWEKSVLATHGFLDPLDFEEIKELVYSINFNDFDMYCLVQDLVVGGFVGVADQKIEMLFLAPEFIGKGLGKKLTEFAIEKLGADKVDVNLQNSPAVAFYKSLGFTTYEQTEKDDQGKNYPLLRMKLSTQTGLEH